jgi:hypothetical protein
MRQGLIPNLPFYLFTFYRFTFYLLTCLPFTCLPVYLFTIYLLTIYLFTLYLFYPLSGNLSDFSCPVRVLTSFLAKNLHDMAC